MRNRNEKFDLEQVIFLEIETHKEGRMLYVPYSWIKGYYYIYVINQQVHINVNLLFCYINVS